MPIVYGFASLFSNPDEFKTLEILVKTKTQNIKAEDFKVILKPKSEQLYLFDNIDKNQPAKLTFTIKSASYFA